MLAIGAFFLGVCCYKQQPQAINGPDAHAPYGLDVIPTQVTTIRTSSPADVNVMPLGVVSLQVWYQGSSIGWVRTDPDRPVDFMHGENRWSARGPIEIENMALFQELYVHNGPIHLPVSRICVIFCVDSHTLLFVKP